MRCPFLFGSRTAMLPVASRCPFRGTSLWPSSVSGGASSVPVSSKGNLEKASQCPFLRLASAVYATASGECPVKQIADSPPTPLPVATVTPSQKQAEVAKKTLDLLKETQVNRYAGSSKPVLISIGLTIETAPVALREKLAVPEPEWPRAIEELCAYPHVQEAAVLSTCNRMEIYAVALSYHRGVREIEDWFCQVSGMSLEELRPHMFLLRDRDAAQHLMRVSAGLNSLVLGEGQILSQVKQVHKAGQQCPGFGRQLNGLFKQAITAGKRARAETSISTGSVSVSSAAAELAQLKLPTHQFDDCRVCIIGAGKMSTLLVKHLESKGCKKITLLNRSRLRAEALSSEFPNIEFSIHLMSDLMQCIEQSDVVFAASSSEEVLIQKADVETMVSVPNVVGGVRRFFDISVPRNIAPEINELQGSAIVYNVDDLKEVVAANKEGRAQAAAEAEILMVEEVGFFEAWRDSLETVPTIKALRNKVEIIRGSEFEKTAGKLGDELTKKQLQAVEEMSRAIVNKMLHEPMAALRCESSEPGAIEQTVANAMALDKIFGLSAEGVLLTASGK